MTVEQLSAFNQIYREMDETYHLYAKGHGISDTVLWLLYALYEGTAAYTQRGLCSVLHYPPQTIHSALKTLEKQGLAELESIPGNKKNKMVVLTEKGQRFVRIVISPLFEAERRAFQRMPEREREQLLSLSQQYACLLREELLTIS